MAICTQTDVENRLQVSLAGSETIVTALIAAAEGHIIREVGAPVEQATHTGELHTARHPFDQIRLDNYPVTAVTAVRVDGVALSTDPAEFSFTSNGFVNRIENGRVHLWDSFKIDAISVDYTAGFSPVPEDLVDICAWMVANTFRVGASIKAGSLEGISREEIGTYAVQFFDTVGDPGAFVSMTDDQRTILRRHYRRAVLGA